MNLAFFRRKSKIFKGFTLIELLVVIAIIGLLSAVVLAALNTARSKGNDAGIKSNLDTIRTQATNYYDTNGAYSVGVTGSVSGKGSTNANCAIAGTFLVTDSTVVAAIASADLASGGAGGATPTNVRCQVDAGTPTSPANMTTTAQATVWSVYEPLSNPTGTTGGVANTGWCIDSGGNAKMDTPPVGSIAVACP